jgi:hypothetical protein
MDEPGDMALVRRQLIGYWLVVFHFPLYGLFAYLRAEDWKALGYLIYVGPMAAYVMWMWMAKMLGTCPARPGYLMHGGNRPHALLVLGFLLLMLLGLLQAGVVGSREPVLAVAEAALLVIMFSFWLLILDTARWRQDGLPRILHGVFVSLLIYLAVNIGAVWLGFESEGQLSRYTREFSALFSPTGVRANFPMAQNGQYFAIVSGILVLLSVLKIRKQNYGNRMLGVTGLVLGVMALAGQSARAPILALGFVLAYGLIWRRLGRVLTPILILSLVVMPVAFVYFDAGRQMNTVLDWIGLDVSRAQGDIISLSNRDVIWSAALNHMFHEATLMHMFFGYGSYGHIASGLYESYRWLFEHSYVGVDYPPLHSSYVQAFVDYGALGIVVLLGVLLVVARRIRTMMLRQRQLRAEATVLVMILIYLSICAVTEIAIGYYAWDLLAIFLLVNLYVMAQRTFVECRTST